MKKIFKFLIVIPAILCSTLFFVLGSSKDVKALSLHSYDVGSYNSNFYEKSTLSSSYLTSFIESVEFEYYIENHSSTTSIVDDITNNTYRYSWSFGNYNFDPNSAGGLSRNYDLATFNCWVQQLPGTTSIYWYSGSYSGFQTKSLTGSYYTWALTCSTYNNSSLTSLGMFSDSPSSVNYYSNSITTTANSSVLVSFAQRTGIYINSLISAVSSNVNGVIIGYYSSPSLPSVGSYYFTPTNYSGNNNKPVFLDTSVTSLTTGNSTAVGTKVANVVSTSHHCPAVTYVPTFSWGGLSYDFYSLPGTDLVQSVYNSSLNACVISTGNPAGTFHASYSYEFLIDDIISQYGIDYANNVLNGITQNVLFVPTSTNNEYASSNFSLSFNHLGAYENVSNIALKTLLNANLNIKVNFRNIYNWAFNSFLWRSNFKIYNNFYILNYVEWNDNTGISAFANDEQHLNSYTSYDLVFNFEREMFPSTSYFDFLIGLPAVTFSTSTTIESQTFCFNFNMAYLSENDMTYFAFQYGASYKDCKWYDILCWLQNGFTYIIYDMPVFSPIINFVKSGISTITSFNSFIGHFTVWGGFMALISVPVTWLVIKKMMGGDK